MKSITFLLVFLIGFRFSAISQSNLQVLVSGGPTFTPKIKYNNSAGYISTVVTGSLGLVYRPVSTFGFELKFSDLSHSTSDLKNDTSNTVKIYTTSQIVLQRILAGFNYYLPIKSIKPFLGVITGATYAQTTQTAPQSSIINFNWGFQTGATLDIAKSVVLRLDAGALFILNVSNNTSYFDAAADGSGFPSFIIGNPSSATIIQWNINLGLLISLGKRNK